MAAGARPPASQLAARRLSQTLTPSLAASSIRHRKPRTSSQSSDSTMPRAYEALNRLDIHTGGRNPARTGRTSAGAWKRYAIFGGVVVGALLFLASGRTRFAAGGQGDLNSTDDNYEMPIKTYPISEAPDVVDGIKDITPPDHAEFDAPEALEPEPAKAKPKKPVKVGGATKPASEAAAKPKGPTGPADDPDPEKTTYCTAPFPGKKLVQYALMIDAGSTGSRIHIYKFNYCAASPMLEYEVFEQLRPGLSTFKGRPAEAAGSLNPLLTLAEKTVPKSLQHCTPVAVKATAGLRLLGKTESDAILKEVEHHIRSDFPFPLASADPVVVMDGKDEGVYAWITANYLLNKIGEGATETDTLAVMDLGGASTQIVFEPTFADDSLFADGDHKYALTFGGREFTLYQHSYLGYGLMRARRSVHNLVAFTWSFAQEGDVWATLGKEKEIANPCLGHGRRKVVELDPPGRTPNSVTMVGGTGGYEACKRVVELVMAKDAICEVQPCSFNGIYQPALIDTFSKGSFLALSYFYDRIRPLFDATTDETTPFTLDTVKTMAQHACQGESHWAKAYKGNEAALKELGEREEYCLDLTFMHALLGLGYEIGSDRELIVGKQLRDVELGWALGAGLAMLDGDLQCLA